MLGMIRESYRFNVVNVVRMASITVGLANGVGRVSRADFVVLILRIRIVRIVGRSGAVSGVGGGCGIWSEVLKGGCTLWVGGLRVTMGSDVTWVLPNHRSARESWRHFCRTWRGGGLRGRVKTEGL